VHFFNNSKYLLVILTTCIFSCPIAAQTATLPASTLPVTKVRKPPIDPVVRTVPDTSVAEPKVKPKKKVRAVASDALKPGQFVWDAAAAANAGSLKIVVLLDIQRLYVFNDSKLVAFSTISSGKPGHETPPGIFPILQKDKDHKSTIYDDAPMPFMQRLTWDGVAMHGGHLPGRPASHGCIRLPGQFAQSLFDITKTGQDVYVLSDADTPPPRPVAPKPVVPAPIVPAPALPVESVPGDPVPPVPAPIDDTL
jgi:lipoprotein-anchoring transpeptidase ErfK/SrfK